MTRVFEELYHRVRSVIVEREYSYPRCTGYGSIHRIAGQHWDDQWSAGEVERVATLNADELALFNRIAQGFASAPADADIRTLEWYLTWEGPSFEDFRQSAKVVWFEPGTGTITDNMTSVSPPNEVFTLTTIRENIESRYAENWTIEWDGTNSLGFTATFREDSIPENHRRFATFNHQITGTAGRLMFGTFWSVNDDGTVTQVEALTSAAVPYYRLQSIGMPLSRSAIDRRIEDEREVYRRNVRARMSGASRSQEERRAEALQQDQRRADAMRRYREFRNKQEPIRENVIGALPFVPHGLKSSLRWGIEVETGAGRDLSRTPDNWDSKDDGSLESAYEDQWIEPEDCPEYAEYHMEPTQDVWHGDRTIAVPNPDFEDPRYCNYCGENGSSYDSDDCIELVSPILSSMHSRGLEAICNDLEFSPRTDTAGVHVHVEAKNLTVKQISQLVLSYDMIEPLIEHSYDRYERGYCKRRSAEDVLEIGRQDSGTVRDMRKGDRYVTVNLCALDAHGTIEFRAMGPKYNYGHLIRWAMFCRSMVQAHANGATSKEFAKAKTWNQVLAILVKYNTEIKTAFELNGQTVPVDAELVEV